MFSQCDTHFVMDETKIPLHEIYNNATDNLEISGTILHDADTQDYLMEIRKTIALIAYPILITFGTFGNLLVFVVMRRGSLKHVSTCFYMSILALADTGNCFV